MCWKAENDVAVGDMQKGRQSSLVVGDLDEVEEISNSAAGSVTVSKKTWPMRFYRSTGKVTTETLNAMRFIGLHLKAVLEEPTHRISLSKCEDSLAS